MRARDQRVSNTKKVGIAMPEDSYGKLRHPLTQRFLVAVSSANGNLVTAFGAAAAQHGCARLGLHAGKKPVGLRAVATVWLKGTLRHLTRLLLNLSLQFATVFQYT